MPKNNYVGADRCFICHGNNNLKTSNIHCGDTVYHPNCIDEYCRQHENIRCPICSTDITDRFHVNTTRKCSPSCSYDFSSCKNKCKCSKCVPLLIGISIILILLTIIMSFVMFHMINKTPLFNLYIVMLCVKIISYIILTVLLGGAPDGPNIICCIDIIYAVILSPLALLIMSCVSIFHPNVLSAYTIIVTFKILMYIAMCTLPFVFACVTIASLGFCIYSICCAVCSWLYSYLCCYTNDCCTINCCTINCCKEESLFVVSDDNV